MKKNEIKYDIFLSYSQDAEDWVRRLSDALKQRGLRVFMNQDQTNRSKSFARQLENALLHSAYVVPIISTPQMSPNQAFEFGAALAFDQLPVSVVADDVPRKSVPAPIRRRPHLPKGNPRRVAERLVKQIASGRNNHHAKRKANRHNRVI